MRPFKKLVVSKRRRRPRILICTPEITELPEGMGNAAQYIRAKGGGLGDISSGLIRYLYEDGRFQLHVALPKYDTKIRDLSSISSRQLDVLVGILNRKGIHLVTDSAFSNLAEVYGDTDASQRVRRAVAYQRHVINYILDDIRPEVVHCNDWMTGLIPPAAREKGIRSLFTLHNVFTEKDTPKNVDQAGIDVRRFTKHLYMETWPEDTIDNWEGNRIDFAASGIHAADMINTVSKTFLQEFIRGDFKDIIPPSLTHIVREKHKQGSAFGILNAPSDTVDPRLSHHIVNYDVDDVVEKKKINKKQFQRQMNLRPDPEAPLFFWPSRLYPQKGPELLYKIALSCVEDHGIQIALVANGHPVMERMFQFLAKNSSGHIAYKPFSEGLSELGKAASDFVLMPSLYEPCGLPQMECPRFGTLPVARLTGGIKDTVFELDPINGTGNGFVFSDFSAPALRSAMERAVGFHNQLEEIKRRNLQRVMRESFARFSLANTAKEYIRIYESLIAKDL